jgi:hypothetical protein
MNNLRPLVLALFCLWLFSPDKDLFALSAILLLFLVKFSWRKNEPKIIFLGVVFYWLTVCTLLLYGVFFNRPMVSLTTTPETFVYTTYLALTATFFYCSGLLLAIRKVVSPSILTLTNELIKYDGRKLLLFYCMYSTFASVFSKTVLDFGGLSQVGVAVIWFKWAFLTLLIIHTLLFPENQKWVYVILFLEVLLSFTGFWASFKDYLFIAAASFLTFNTVVNIRRILLIGVLAFSAFALMVVWTVVKGDYRQYLTGGKMTQEIEQESKLGNLRKLSELIGENFSGEKFSENVSKGVADLANRINYTEYFAMSVRQVPKVLPFEKGELLMGGFEHVFKPRLFFPYKKSIDDSQMTSKYTGRRFAGESQGASFSLGQVAERYIDYGPVYMFIPIFFFGILLGTIYRYIITHSANHILGLSFVAPLFFLIPSLGVATTKFLGWLFTYFIVWFFFNKYVIKVVNNLLMRKE